MNIIRIGSNLIVTLSDGSVLSNAECTDELFNNVFANQGDEEEVRKMLSPNLSKQIVEFESKSRLMNNFEKSKYLTVSGSSVYLKSISELTVPEDLAVAIFEAEEQGNQTLIQTYLNFWTLASLNPDSRARLNLFWFLSKYGMTITKSGLFVAYRNVKVKIKGTDTKRIDEEVSKFVSSSYVKIKGWKKSPANYIIVNSSVTGLYCTKKEDEKGLEHTEKVLGTLDSLYKNLSNEEVATVYTDNYSGSFTIKIGEVVSMSRKDCDAVQENTCSRGLHVASKDWLNSNGSGFGTTSLVVLVNPVDVVAVPPRDSYGKMRVCAYYPVQVVERQNGIVKDNPIDNGFEDDFIGKITYTGDINNEDAGNYQIVIPVIPELNRSNILSRLAEIKKSTSKYVN